MDKSSRLFFSVLPVFLILILIVLFLVLFSGSDKQQDTAQVQRITQWQWQNADLTLPAKLSCPKHRTFLKLTAQIQPSKGDYLYLKTVYAPLKVYVDEKLMFQYGQPGSYPAFLLDPPTKVAIFPLPDTDRMVTLTFEYFSPSQRNHVTLHPVLMGKPDAILSHLIAAMGFSLFFSVILIVLGILLSLTALAATRFEQTGIALFWLGLFSFCTGSWVLGECNLTGLFIKHPGILYGIAFCSLFAMPIPIIKFCMVIFGSHKKRLLNTMCHILELSFCTAVILQLMGIASLSKTMYLFHLLVPLSLCLCGICILHESRKEHNLTARRFLFPIMVLALFSLLEVANYYLLCWNVQKSFFFQIGVLVSLVMCSVQCGYFICGTFMLILNNRQLAFRVSLMEKQIRTQKEQYQLLSETSAKLRQQRHDLKHHMAVIQRWTLSGEKEKLLAYLDEISSAIPKPLGNLCNNEAVNAVALHYQAAALEAKIHLVIRLDIPSDTGQVPANDLCVIIGNLFENGIEACRGTKDPFLTLQSRLSDGILTITMDNRFSSIAKTPEGTYCSLKSDGGIGLLSIQSVAEKYGGNSRFEDGDGVFHSSVYLYLFP